jgi:Spy/CpxP family protein refolding chaperone
MMKRELLTFGLISAALLPAFAGPQGEGSYKERWEELNLSAEQKQQVMKIRKSHMDAMHEEIGAILTPEQKTKYEAMQKDMKERWAQKRAQKQMTK